MTRTFADLDLIRELLAALEAEKYVVPTPIQVQAIPHILAGRDLLGIAQTGTGKTAAFALPILQELARRPARDRKPRVLVLAPTRELAAQIGDSFAVYGRNLPATCVVIFGGVGQDRQVRDLRQGVDVLVATPGRLLDLMQQGHVSLANVAIFVLDEADRMLDMGFIHDVRRIARQVPRVRQTLLFSATMPDEVAKLAKSLLHDPVRVEVTPQATPLDAIEQGVYFAAKADKSALLAELLASDPSMRRVLVFTRTKHGANRLVNHLLRRRFEAEALHGNKTQSARERALANFKRGVTRVLVATDIAARGLDVDDISHVVNFDLPEVPETYVHRIGRTARAGNTGVALSFCDPAERGSLLDIERLTRRQVPRLAGEAPRRPSAPTAAPSPRPPASIPPVPPPQRSAPNVSRPRPVVDERRPARAIPPPRRRGPR